MNIATLATSTIVNINNKIEFKQLKEGRHTRTFLCGLHNFMTSEEIDTFVIDLKKKLGAGVKTTKEKNDFEYGFLGDHKDRIRSILIDQKKIASTNIA